MEAKTVPARAKRIGVRGGLRGRILFSRASALEFRGGLNSKLYAKSDEASQIRIKP